MYRHPHSSITFISSTSQVRFETVSIASTSTFLILHVPAVLPLRVLITVSDPPYPIQLSHLHTHYSVSHPHKPAHRATINIAITERVIRAIDLETLTIT
jgi:hypothetical protein